MLSVSAYSEDHRHLRRLFGHTNWILLEAGTCRDALAILQRQPVAVMISEGVLPDGSWRDLLRQAGELSRRPCLIVTSRLADEQMWVDVLDCGGFNVLEKPFDATEVFRVVSSAWLTWSGREGQTSRSAAAG